MAYFNAAGTIMFLLAFGAGYGITRALDIAGEGPWMMIAGPLLVALDLAYRGGRRASWFRATGGGAFLLLPVWIWGLFWAGLGACYYWRVTG